MTSPTLTLKDLLGFHQSLSTEREAACGAQAASIRAQIEALHQTELSFVRDLNNNREALQKALAKDAKPLVKHLGKFPVLSAMIDVLPGLTLTLHEFDKHQERETDFDGDTYYEEYRYVDLWFSLDLGDETRWVFVDKTVNVRLLEDNVDDDTFEFDADDEEVQQRVETALSRSTLALEQAFQGEETFRDWWPSELMNEELPDLVRAAWDLVMEPATLTTFGDS